MNSILFKNAKILTKDFEIIEGDLAVCGGKIAFPKKDADQKYDRTIDVKKNLLMPSFKNCHTHSAMTLLRGIAEDLPLLKWLHERVFPLEAQLCEEDVYYGTKLAILEYVKNGITAAADMYFFPEATKKAAEDCAFNIFYIGAVSDYGADADTQLDQLERLYTQNKNGNHFKTNAMGMHAEYTCNDYLLKNLAVLAKKHNAPLFTHLSESASEVEDCLKKWGKTPLKRLLDFGLFENGGGVYHAVHPKNDDIELLKSHNIAVITNPSSNLKLASGIAPLVSYQRAGIKIGLGTDGAASNNALDMFREMYLACVLQKYSQNDPTAMPVSMVLKIALENSAHIIGQPNSQCLCEGGNADLIMVDLNAPNMQPSNNSAADLIFSANSSNILLTMSNGKILFEQGNYYVDEPPENIYKKCKQIVLRLSK